MSLTELSSQIGRLASCLNDEKALSDRINDIAGFSMKMHSNLDEAVHRQLIASLTKIFTTTKNEDIVEGALQLLVASIANQRGAKIFIEVCCFIIIVLFAYKFVV